MNDIAGPFAGNVFGISNTIGTIPGMVAPLLTLVITKHHTQKEWQVVFWITAVIYFVGGTVCMILLEATTQTWAEVAIEIDAEPEKNYLFKPLKDENVINIKLDKKNIAYF
jgi:hypothetical protein